MADTPHTRCHPCPIPRGGIVPNCGAQSGGAGARIDAAFGISGTHSLRRFSKGRGLRRRGVYLPQAGWTGFLLKLLVALVVMAGVLWFGAGPDSMWVEIGGLARGLRLAAVVGAGALAYFLTLFALGFRPRDFRRRGA